MPGVFCWPLFNSALSESVLPALLWPIEPLGRKGPRRGGTRRSAVRSLMALETVPSRPSVRRNGSGNRPALWHYAEATAAQVPLCGEPNAEYRADKLCSRSELPIAKTVIEITTGLRRGDLAFTTAAPRSAVRRRGRGQATSSGLSFLL